MKRTPVECLAIGASAGGIEALFTVLGELQPGFAGAVVIVLHLPEDHESRLADAFASRLGVPVAEARPGAQVAPGAIHFAPPGYHLLVEEDRTFALSCDPPVQFSRPSIDVLLESCADVYGPRGAGLILTGANEDGARGLARIAAAGGVTAVQDPAQAAWPAMPAAALRLAAPRHVLPLRELARLVHTLLTP